MPISRQFVFEEDDDTGLIGLKPLWIGNANTTTAVAHDMLEHFIVPALNTAEAEFAAVGALLALRIENGVFSNYRTPEEQFAEVVFSVLTDVERDSLELPRFRQSRHLSDDYCWADELIESAVPKAFEMRKREFATETADGAYVPEVLLEQQMLTPTLCALLRLGYRRALKRFEGVDLYTLGNSTFKRLDDYSRRLVQSEMLSIGDRVIINVDVKRAAFSSSVNGYSLDI